MAETEQIEVAQISEGAGGTGRPGTRVRLPVVELLTGRGFVTGKSGSGKSNTASVIAERLLDNGFGLLVVDIDGEYYGLKEEYEILHAGGDEECDIQVTADHAEKLASLALEENVPIILDVSSFLDTAEAEALLTAVAKQLFAKAKKQKQPFLLLVEEVHEYIPENGSVGECGRMLIKIGKRGRKHGLGICGISQRPADVKKDFITQCDWLVWHRLTWDNDTKVVRRVLDGEYASAVEDLDDGEGFLKTDWAGTVRRVQFDRKQTFDAGATPGLDDVERPELKSVSDDLVSELAAISDDRQRREDRIADLREELDRKNSRIAELEAELQDARDLSRMADQFVDALVEEVSGSTPGRTERKRLQARRRRQQGDANTGSDGDHETGDRTTPDTPAGDAFDLFPSGDAESTGDDAPAGGVTTNGERANGTSANGDGTNGEGGTDGVDDAFAAFAAMGDESGTDAESTPSAGDSSEATNADVEAAFQDVESTATPEPEGTVGADVSNAVDRDSESRRAAAERGAPERRFAADKPTFVREVLEDLTDLDARARGMLAHYQTEGPATPISANLAAGGSGERTTSYALNRQLRTGGYIEHVGRGTYRARLGDCLADAASIDLEAGVLRQYANFVVSQVAGPA